MRYGKVSAVYEYISSKNNDKIKDARKLADKKYRAQFGLFVIEGRKLVYDYLRTVGVPVRIFATEAAAEKYSDIIKAAEIYIVSEDLYAYISGEKAPQGIMAVCRIPNQGGLIPGHCLILESLRDAGNLGTVIRTAAAFGIENIVLSADCADLYNPKTLRAAMGALFFVNVFTVADIVAFVDTLRSGGRRVFATVPAEGATDIRTVSFAANDCVVIGNEGNGISDELLSHCDLSITIPMRGQTESLNASAAASVLMWELVRGGEL